MRFSGKAVAGVATSSGLGGVLAAACCCVLPLALASVGIGASGLARFGPLHTPLSAIALVAVIAGWLLYFRHKSTSRLTLGLLIVASIFVVMSAVWYFIEDPLMRALGG
jgi:mercuric ion transport protein